jgi:hypothetical protein
VSPHIQADQTRAPRGIAPGQLATTGVLSRPASSPSPRLSLAHGIACNFLVHSSLAVNQPLILQPRIFSTSRSPQREVLGSGCWFWMGSSRRLTYLQKSGRLVGDSDTVLDSSSDDSACRGPDGSPKNSISLCPV